MVTKSLGCTILLALTMSGPAFAQYMSTPPPGQGSSSQPPAVRPDSLTIKPKNGQSEQQQWADRYECHKWAKDQSSFDPTLRAPRAKGCGRPLRHRAACHGFGSVSGSMGAVRAGRAARP